MTPTFNVLNRDQLIPISNARFPSRVITEPAVTLPSRSAYHIANVVGTTAVVLPACPALRRACRAFVDEEGNRDLGIDTRALRLRYPRRARTRGRASVARQDRVKLSGAELRWARQC